MHHLIHPFTLIGLLLATAPLAAETLPGMWLIEDRDVRVEIVPTATGFDALLRDNPENARANGKRIMQLNKQNKNTGDWSGTFYALKQGAELDAIASLSSADTLQIKLKKGFIRRTIQWRRLDTPD